MPQMEGIEAVERIVRQHSDARIVMVSSVGYQENIPGRFAKGRQALRPETPRKAFSAIRDSRDALKRR